MNERHEIILSEAKDGPNPPDLLQQIVKDVKELVPTTVKAAGRYIGGKGEQQIAKAQEIKSRVLERIGQLELERQKLIEQREEKLRAQEIELLREKRKAFETVADRVESLRKHGIEIDLAVVKQAASDLLKGR